ncbi:hypothetical protein FHX44_118107 [Pseudonocardia hierapolitana]|uniref:Uncharacterized protein n=1 Tax=Pseudonocardia hierapolitana TaxID=1128676 RepID=A0A561T4Y5_9PSEU|nr:hypothetical protein [Pseudonocardia hierapolitana]TWF82162.1 hypothetical protein FHX44_118107 [Pseudonocardia hierapolitana]
MTRVEDVRDPSVVDAVIPVVTLVVLIGGSLALFGLDALDGPLQLALVSSPGSFWGRPRPTWAIPVSSSPPSPA